MTSFVITDILTESEIEICWELYSRLAGTGRFKSAVVDEILLPKVMERIEKKLGHKMDAGYVGYAIEYVFMTAEMHAPSEN